MTFLIGSIPTLSQIVTHTSTTFVQKSYAQNITSNYDTNTKKTIEGIKNNITKLQSQVEELNKQIGLLTNSIIQLQDSNLVTQGDLDNSIEYNSMQFSNALNELGSNTQSNLDGVWNCIVFAANYASQNGGFYDFADILNRNCQ